MKIKNIEKKQFNGKVYNFSVKDDESYIANGVKVHNCRGIWVEILKDEVEKPEIGGVPSGLRNRFDGKVNELVQPQQAIPKRDSIAEEFLKNQ